MIAYLYINRAYGYAVCTVKICWIGMGSETKIARNR